MGSHRPRTAYGAWGRLPQTALEVARQLAGARRAWRWVGKALGLKGPSHEKVSRMRLERANRLSEHSGRRH
eukprot:jgi/Mesen1/1636/ME000135S00632